MDRTQLKWGARISLAGAAILAVSALVLGQAASGQPPGNNGTVKIDGVAFDDHPNNEPHVGCVFQVDFENYDEVEGRIATVTFTLVPPTAGPVLVDADEVDISGGSGSGTYDLTDALAASGVEPHPQQGFHIRLDVHAEGSIGADTKHKVFWVECEEVPGTTTTTMKETTTTTAKDTTTTTAKETTTTVKDTTTTTMKGTTTTAKGGETTTTVKPAAAPVAPPSPPGGAGQLPVTGVPTLPLAAGGLALLGLGLGLMARRAAIT